MSKEKLVLAYSGGLDTTVILHWLSKRNYQVIACIADVGQKDDFSAIREKALKSGAHDVVVSDLKKEFVTDFIFPALRANAVYEGRYLLGTALSRPLIAKELVRVAEKFGANKISHGSTGKGNDQVRFELACYALKPEIEIISPWKDPVFLSEFTGRSCLLEYSTKYGIPVSVTSSRPYSEDDNLMHISHEAGSLEDPMNRPDKNVFTMTSDLIETPDHEEIIEITFMDGIPVRVVNRENGADYADPLELYTYLNQIGGIHGIGRLDMVENRFIGLKSRGVYESPGATILWKAHRDLEGLAMDMQVMHLRDSISPKLAEIIYNGFWFSPEKEFIMAAVNKSQEAIDGIVQLALHKGNVQIIGRSSPTSLYNEDLVSMDIEGGFNALDVKGFIEVNAIRLKAHNTVMRSREKEKVQSETLV